MAGYASLEKQFLDSYDQVKTYYRLERYEECLIAIKQTADLCKRIYEESVDSQKKAVMLKNFEKIKLLYKEVKSHVSKDTVLNNSSRHSSNNTSVNSDVDANSVEKDGIKYVFLGHNGEETDVRRFIIEDTSDKVLFKDIIGMNKDKKLIQREFFPTQKQIKFRKERSIKNKKGILLYGLPGTGKTFFAKAISNEFKAASGSGDDIKFYCINSSVVRSSHPGETEANVNVIFEFARQFKRCVLFFDEFDSIVPSRNIDTGDPTDKKLVDTFLQLMDGFTTSGKTLVIGATNYPNLIDSGVLSRLNVHIEVPLPVKEIIYKSLVKDLSDFIADDVSLDDLAERLVGYSMRDIKNFVAFLFDLSQAELEDDEFNNLDKDTSEYKITNRIIEEALKSQKSSIKLEEKLKIEEFKASRAI